MAVPGTTSELHPNSLFCSHHQILDTANCDKLALLFEASLFPTRLPAFTVHSRTDWNQSAPVLHRKTREERTGLYR